YIYDSFRDNGKLPTETEVKSKLQCFRDLVAYRIVISLPKCHLNDGENREEAELKLLYEVADILPDFLEERGFTAEFSGLPERDHSERLAEKVRPYYRDYIANSRPFGYQSLHITLYDNFARCYTEVQLRTKDMDDNAEIGEANHLGYEKRQESSRTRREAIPEGECVWFDEAYERVRRLQEIDLSKVDVNMFRAADNFLINDGCGLFRGRQILPFEHLSRFQNDLID
ncbi:MAG: guanosine polyphosphate pyrophosphohydrolase, partial [Ruminiclostridium sp.]|nr:guanosine polyphosphate pyrophosphohydrolase [Ruminiclostridium sp.]